LGTGAALPGAPVPTEELLRRIEVNFGVQARRQGGLVAKRMGIEFRHICRDFKRPMESPRPGDANPDLAASALRQALEEARLKPNDLGYLLGHTTTPHTLLPPNIAWVADRLGYDNPYVELRQACTGFANALQLATGLLSGPGAAPVGIVGSETGSVFFDPMLLQADREQLVNLVQMGDGAGAVVLSADDGQPGARIEALFFGSLGHGHRPGFYLSAGGSARAYASPEQLVSVFQHDFAGVKERGLELFVKGLAAAREAGVEVEAVDWVIPHQANARMGEVLAPVLDIPQEKFVIEADRVGNLGSASIWLALHHLRTSGRLCDGDSVLVLGAEATKYLYGGFVYRHGGGD
jgi:3-oxoacyl-[acyl-carrier-protein] synthase-3